MFGERATGSSWHKGQLCIVVAGVIIIIVVIVAGIIIIIAGVIVIVHGTKASLKQWVGRESVTDQVSSKRVGCESVADHQSIWHKGQSRAKGWSRGHRPLVIMDYCTANFGKRLVARASRTTVSYCTNNHGT